MVRKLMISLTLIFSLLTQVALAANDQTPGSVVTHGGDSSHSNYYPDMLLPWLCLDWEKPLPGHSFSQPLLVGSEIYFLNGNKLYRYSLTGDVLGTMVWPSGSSRGQMTYFQVGPTLQPTEDWLFVPNPGPPWGITAIHPAEVLGSSTPPADRMALTEVPEQEGMQGAYAVVSAPIYFPETDTTVFGTVSEIDWTSGHVQASQNITNGGSRAVETAMNGWISGSPLKVTPSRFLIGVSGGVSFYEVNLSGTVGTELLTRLDTLIQGSDVISSVAGDLSKGGSFSPYTSTAYVDDKTGNVYALDFRSGALETKWSSPPPFQSFSNSEPAIDGSKVYLPIRWPGPDSTHPEGNYGAIAAYDKTTGELTWTHTFDDIATERRPTWINQPPIVVGSSTPTILAGDAGGHIMALDQNGTPYPFVLTDDADRPIPCSRLEDPAWDGTGVRLSPVASLSDQPYVRIGSMVWTNRSGIGSGLIFARDRLLTAVNEGPRSEDLPDVETSVFVALRTGTNTWVDTVVLRQDGEDRTPDRINLSQPVTAAVTVNWRVPGDGRSMLDLPMLVGWSDQEPAALTVPAPSGEGTVILTAELPARTDGARRAGITVLANPGFYAHRRGAEDVPAIPAAWQGAVDRYAASDLLASADGSRTLGEVRASDNLTSVMAGSFHPPVASLTIDPASLTVGTPVQYTVRCDDPQGLPKLREEWEDRPPQPSYDRPGTYRFTYRCQNTAGLWSEPATGTLQVMGQRPPDGQAVGIDVAFDPPEGHRGHSILMTIALSPPAAYAGHEVTDFQVDDAYVELPDAFVGLSACTSYSCWDAPNDQYFADGAGLDWTYPFELPAPTPDPSDGEYTVLVGATGTYSWEDEHVIQEWRIRTEERTYVDPYTGESVTVEETTGYWEVVRRYTETHSDEWTAETLVPYLVQGQHEYVHPVTGGS